MTLHPYQPVPTLDEFGARLALIRWHMHWNQKEAALATGLPHGSWREWELGGRAPRNLVEVARKISASTGYDDYWIMTGLAIGLMPQFPKVALDTTSQVAARAHVDPSTVRVWVSKGLLKPTVTTPGGHHRFSAESVDELLNTEKATA